MRWSALGGVVAAGLTLSSLLLLPAAEDPPRDPSRRGPERTLAIQRAEIDASGRLQVSGSTSLPDGATLAVLLLADGRQLASYRASALGGGFSLQLQGAGEVLPGRYRAIVEFRIEDQSPAVARALSYQPAHLSADSPLTLPVQLLTRDGPKLELESLIMAVNLEPRDPPTLDALDTRARALSDRLWIAKEKAAIHKLRLAIEEARRPGQLRRSDFERLLLEAHVLAGL